MIGVYAIALVFSIAGLYLAMRAIRTPQVGPRAVLSLLTMGVGIVAMMAWMIPRWVAAAEREAATYQSEIRQGEDLAVGWDVRSLAKGMPSWVWVPFLGAFALLMILGEPKWRSRLLHK